MILPLIVFLLPIADKLFFEEESDFFCLFIFFQFTEFMELFGIVYYTL